MARLTVGITLLLLCGAASADRTVELIENSVETLLSEVTMPGGPGGTVIISATCEGCEPRSLRAATDIRFAVDDTPLPHGEFMDIVGELRDTEGGGNAEVGIYYGRQSGFVTRIVLFTDND